MHQTHFTTNKSWIQFIKINKVLPCYMLMQTKFQLVWPYTNHSCVCSWNAKLYIKLMTRSRIAISESWILPIVDCSVMSRARKKWVATFLSKIVYHWCVLNVMSSSIAHNLFDFIYISASHINLHVLCAYDFSGSSSDMVHHVKHSQAIHFWLAQLLKTYCTPDW